MNRTEIYEKVCILLDRLNLIDKKAESLEMDAKLDECGLTSFTFIQFLVELENEFNMHIDDEELFLEQFDTLDKIVCFIDAKQSGK